jgi:hypothetical protein
MLIELKTLLYQLLIKKVPNRATVKGQLLYEVGAAKQINYWFLKFVSQWIAA